MSHVRQLIQVNCIGLLSFSVLFLSRQISSLSDLFFRFNDLRRQRLGIDRIKAQRPTDWQRRQISTLSEVLP